MDDGHPTNQYVITIALKSCDQPCARSRGGRAQGRSNLFHRCRAICPHGPIDVRALDCDFLVWSAYKCFGPHLGILYGKYDLLNQLTAYKVRPAGDFPSYKFETGTQSFEGIAGTLGALEYLQWVGEMFGAEFGAPYGNFKGRQFTLKKTMAAIRKYELNLSRTLIVPFSKLGG